MGIPIESTPKICRQFVIVPRVLAIRASSTVEVTFIEPRMTRRSSYASPPGTPPLLWLWTMALALVAAVLVCSPCVAFDVKEDGVVNLTAATTATAKGRKTHQGTAAAAAAVENVGTAMAAVEFNNASVGAGTGTEWDPRKVTDPDCPNLITVNTGKQGFGDQLERYIFALNLAKILNGTLLLRNSFETGPSRHKGHEEYAELAAMLGIDASMTYGTMILQQYLELLQPMKLPFEEYLLLMQRHQGGAPPRLCHKRIEADILSCGSWCPFSHPTYKFVKEVQWLLRDNTAHATCLEHQQQQGQRGLLSLPPRQQVLQPGRRRRHLQQGSVPPPPSVRGSPTLSMSSSTTTISMRSMRSMRRRRLTVVWHVRTGDVCLRCRDTTYHEALLDLIMDAASLNSTDQVDLTFESQKPLPWLKEAFPWARYAAEAPPNPGNHNPPSSLSASSEGGGGGTLKDAICHILLADVFVTSGSSLANVAAFAPGPPFGGPGPLIFEERRKEASWTPGMTQHHIFTDESAVLLEDGAPVSLTRAELRVLMRTHLESRRRARSRSATADEEEAGV